MNERWNSERISPLTRYSVFDKIKMAKGLLVVLTSTTFTIAHWDIELNKPLANPKY